MRTFIILSRAARRLYAIDNIINDTTNRPMHEVLAGLAWIIKGKPKK